MREKVVRKWLYRYYFSEKNVNNKKAYTLPKNKEKQRIKQLLIDP